MITLIIVLCISGTKSHDIIKKWSIHVNQKIFNRDKKYISLLIYIKRKYCI